METGIREDSETEESYLITVLRPYPFIDIESFFRLFYSSKSQGSEVWRTLQGEDIRTKEPLTTPLYEEEDEKLSDFEEGIKEANYHEPIALERRQLSKILPKWSGDGN